MSKYHANELLNNRKNDIQHWKYVKKISVGKGYRYFYSWDEYRAYLRDPLADVSKNKVKVNSEITNTKKKAQKYISKGKKSIEKQIIKNKNKIEEKVDSKSKANLTVGSVKKINASRDKATQDGLLDIARSAKKMLLKGSIAKELMKAGEKWLDSIINPKSAKEKIAEKKEKLAKKYKYIAKETINGHVVYFYSQDELNAWKRKQDYIKNEPEFMNDVKKSKVPFTSDEDAILVNPKYDSWDDKYSYNCAECTAIYELRRRGYDVESNGESGLGDNAEKYNSDKRYKLFYKDPKIDYIPQTSSSSDTAKELEKAFAKYPPGSRGDFSFQWDGYNAGHSIVWEKDSKGKVHLIDTQVSGHGNKVEYDINELSKEIDNNTKYKTSLFSRSRTGTRIVRTDNLELKPEVKNICQNSTGVKNKPATGRYNKKVSRFSSDQSSLTMTEKEIVTRYPNLYDPDDINDYNRHR